MLNAYKQKKKKQELYNLLPKKKRTIQSIVVNYKEEKNYTS